MHARAYLRQRFKFPWDLYWVNKTKEVYSFKVNWFLGEILKKLFPDSGNHGTDCFKGVDCLFRKIRICSPLRQPPSSKKGNCKPQWRRRKFTAEVLSLNGRKEVAQYFMVSSCIDTENSKIPKYLTFLVLSNMRASVLIKVVIRSDGL